jgi:hypothetical protein
MAEVEPQKEGLRDANGPTAPPGSSVVEGEPEGGSGPKEELQPANPSEPALDRAKITEMLGKDIKQRIERQAKAKANRKGGVGADEKQSLYNTRIEFQTLLSKLSEYDTKNVAMNKIQDLISRHAQQQELRIFLSSLCEDNKPYSVHGKEAQVCLLGFIAETYKETMMDPMDKPPSLLKTVMRVCDTIHRYLKVKSLHQP